MTTETNTENLGPKGHQFTTVSGTGVVSVTTQDASTFSRTSTVTRVYTTDHKAVGWLYPKPYRRTVSVYNRGHGVWEHTRYPQSTSGSIINKATRVGVIAGYASHLNVGDLPPASATLQSRAEVKALLNLKDQRINLAQAYAERKMTADLVSSSLNRMTQSVLALRQRQFRRAWELLGGNPRKLPQTWLEYQYGWRPLMNDCKGAVDALQRYDKSQDWVVSVKGSAKEESDVWDDISGTYSANRRVVKKNGCFVRLDYTPKNGFLSALASLGLTNPYQLAWEVLPYSFVIDWYLPIGEWLSAMDADAGYDFLSGSRSTRRETTTFVRAVDRSYPLEPTYRKTQTNYRCFRREFDLQRTIYESSPIPIYPGLKNPLTGVHVANALSLFAQALGSSPPRVR